MKKTFILDTNVLLYDAESLLSFDDNNIIIPLIVLEELDGHKRRPDEVGKNARRSVRMLDKLRDDIAGKFDGCALDGDPRAVDQNDWIMNCDAQDKVYPYLKQAITILDDMLSAP